MTKINIISGFLGAGKTTFIKRLIEDVFKGEKLVLIENEFGEIGVDGGFLQDAGIEITEMISGCICCSLVGDFTKALEETIRTYSPDRILIEPSGVGKLSDVIAAVSNAADASVSVDASITVVDCTKCKMYRKNFGEFYENQILYADCVLLSRTDKADEKKIEQAVHIIREINKDTNIITTPLEHLSRDNILDAFRKQSMEQELLEETRHEHEHHHHHHEHDEHCECGCHEHEHEHGHHHHHHEHDEHCECGCHEHEHEHGHHHHHHEHDEHCECGCHEHEHEHGHHHHHHHADETFSSWGMETVRKYTREEIEQLLSALDSGDYGTVLRAKGMVDAQGEWLYFDYVPGETDVRSGSPCIIGKICVIGAELKEDQLAVLFGKAD